MSKIKLPTHWTAQEARAVYEFLEEIRQKIFYEYVEQIEELCREECWEENLDDEIEF